MVQHDGDCFALVNGEHCSCSEETKEARRWHWDATDLVIDAAHIAHQRAWSLKTFGPGPRTAGVIDHIRRELVEIEEDPTDLEEWADLLILSFDGAYRHGHEPQAIIDQIKAKQAKNEQRNWPDWRTAPSDEAIEHLRN